MKLTQQGRNRPRTLRLANASLTPQLNELRSSCGWLHTRLNRDRLFFFLLRLFLLFVIFLLGIESPQIVAATNVRNDIVNSGHGGEHGMVLIVVFVHAVTTDKEQVVELVYPGDHFGEAAIRSEISWIRLGHPNH